MKFPLLVLAGLMAAVMTACFGETTEVYVGTLVTGVVATEHATEDAGPLQVYTIFVREGVEHYIYLNSPDGNIAGIWSVDEDAYIIEAEPPRETLTISHIFPETGYQTLFLKSLDPTLLSSFTFKIWAP